MNNPSGQRSIAAPSHVVERGHALWLFGPPAAGKTTVATALKKALEARDVPVVLFDGDITREIVAQGLGRSIEERKLITHRYSALTSYLTESRIIVILAAINHTNEQRAYARAHHPDSDHEPLPSLIENADGVVLTRDTMQYFSSHVCSGGDFREIANDWRMSPLLAEDHTNVAPAYIATCELDPIRDEGNLYADKLAAAGVPVQHKEWKGQPHLLFQLSPVLDDGKAMIAECVDALKKAFG